MNCKYLKKKVSNELKIEGDNNNPQYVSHMPLNRMHQIEFEQMLQQIIQWCRAFFSILRNFFEECVGHEGAPMKLQEK